MTIKKLMLASLLGLASLPAVAAALDEGNDQPAVRSRVITIPGEGMSVHLGQRDGFVPFMHPGMQMHGKLVKNAPYSAEVLMERQQNLADGNQISTKTTSMSYRDSSGRTRQELRDGKGELASVTINDPVERVSYVLHPKDKTATKVGVPPEIRAAAEAARAAGEAARARVEQLRKEGKTVSTEHQREREELIIRRVERGDNGNVTRSREMRIELGPMIANAFGDAKWSAKPAMKDLGTRDFDGVKAQGKLSSYDIPAGAVGNRNPIVVSDETWYAPDLQVTVYNKHSDPRSGDVIYRLDNVRRDEPQAALFTVPSDYTVKDALANIARKIQVKEQ